MDNNRYAQGGIQPKLSILVKVYNMVIILKLLNIKKKLCRLLISQISIENTLISHSIKGV